MVEVTAKRRLFLVTAVTPISTQKWCSLDGGPSQGWVSAVYLGKILINCWRLSLRINKDGTTNTQLTVIGGWLYVLQNTKTEQQEEEKHKILVHGWLSATTLDLLFHACLLALCHSRRHGRTTLYVPAAVVMVLLLCCDWLWCCYCYCCPCCARRNWRNMYV